jgi:hypothetical protein
VQPPTSKTPPGRLSAPLPAGNPLPGSNPPDEGVAPCGASQARAGSQKFNRKNARTQLVMGRWLPTGRLVASESS